MASLGEFVSTMLLRTIRAYLWLLTFRILRKLLPKAKARQAGLEETNHLSADQLTWAVPAASRYVSQATCLTQVLAIQPMLARLPSLIAALKRSGTEIQEDAPILEMCQVADASAFITLYYTSIRKSKGRIINKEVGMEKSEGKDLVENNEVRGQAKKPYTTARATRDLGRVDLWLGRQS